MAKDFVKLSKEWFDKQAPVYDATDTILYSKYGKISCKYIYNYLKDKIKESYKSFSKIYNDVMTQGSFWSKLYIKLFWQGVDDNEVAEKVLEYIPNNFNGKWTAMDFFHTLQSKLSLLNFLWRYSVTYIKNRSPFTMAFGRLI